MADTGTIIKLHPPHNTGAANGSGMIISSTGNAFVFHTPTDNDGATLAENDTVNFTVDSHGKVTGVSTGIIVIPPSD